VTTRTAAAAVASFDAEDEMAERAGWLLAERARAAIAPSVRQEVAARVR
jgi:hypothetical protein